MNETIATQSEVPAILQFIPLIVFTLPFLILIGFIAHRKGKNIILSIILGILPFINIIYAMWLASQTDASVIKRLDALENK